MRSKGLPFLQRLPHLSNRRSRFRARHVVQLKEHPMLPACAPIRACCLSSLALPVWEGGRLENLMSTAAPLACRHADGNLVKEALAEHPEAPFFVIVRPRDTAATAGSTPRYDASETADVSSVTSALSQHPSSFVSASLLQPTCTGSPRSAGSSGGACTQVRRRGTRHGVPTGFVNRRTEPHSSARHQRAGSCPSGYPEPLNAASAAGRAGGGGVTAAQHAERLGGLRVARHGAAGLRRRARQQPQGVLPHRCRTTCAHPQLHGPLGQDLRSLAERARPAPHFKACSM